MIDRMIYCAKQLIANLELDNGNNPESINRCVNEFVTSVVDAWSKFEQGKIKVTIKQLPRTMYMFATEELPREINNPEKRDKLIKELKLFINTIEHVLTPKEEE